VGVEGDLVSPGKLFFEDLDEVDCDK